MPIAPTDKPQKKDFLSSFTLGLDHLWKPFSSKEGLRPGTHLLRSRGPPPFIFAVQKACSNAINSEMMKNPFPGMNPWLEEYWRDFHAKFIVYACDQLNGELPSGLQARVDERIAIGGAEERPTHYLPDVAVTESWDRPAGPVLGQGGQRVNAANPTVIDFGEEILRHIEIVDSRAHVITAIELLSPSNKEDAEARANWKQKRFDYLRGGINLVEIDLLRGGGWALPDRTLLKPNPPGRIVHHVCVTRPPRLSRAEFYVLPLRERLPVMRVPLRRTDPDVALDLQLLADQCYERGRYGAVIDYSKPPHPPLPDEEAAWARHLLTN